MLPTEIKIGNRIISVEVTTIDPKFMGLYDPNALTIQLSDTLSPTQTIETFWHELIHAINDYNRTVLTLSQELETPEKDTTEQAFNIEESMTEDFAMTFLMVIQDNNLLPVKENVSAV